MAARACLGISIGPRPTLPPAASLLTRATLTTPLPGSVLWRVQGLLVSGLTGETGELTFVAKGKAGERLTMDGVLQELERLIDELISPTKVIRVGGRHPVRRPGGARAEAHLRSAQGTHRLSRAPPQAAGMIAQSSMCEDCRRSRGSTAMSAPPNDSDLRTTSHPQRHIRASCAPPLTAHPPALSLCCVLQRLPSKQGGVSVSVATELPASLFGSSGHFVGRHGGRQDPRGRGAASSERRSGPFPFRAGGGAFQDATTAGLSPAVAVPKSGSATDGQRAAADTREKGKAEEAEDGGSCLAATTLCCVRVAAE